MSISFTQYDFVVYSERNVTPVPLLREENNKGLAKIKLALACYTPNPLILEGCQWN